jgi:alpha/beta superfamily hydrolase
LAESITFTSERPTGAAELDGVLALPDRQGPGPGLLVCHPHPAGGGAMDVGLLEVIERRGTRAGLAVMRFNFAGVGGSTGTFTDGLEEPLDVAAAFEYLSSRAEVDDVSIAGWSFGAWMALMAIAEGLPAASCVAVAPPIMLYDWRQQVGRIASSTAVRHYIVGSNDQFCPLGFLQEFALAVSEQDSQNVMTMPATDHFLFGREDMVAELVIEFVHG